MLCLPPASHIHLIAVCGTAMGSLAAMLEEQGHRVTGSDDHVYPPMSDFLRESGIEVQAGFDQARLNPAPDLTIVGNAVSRGNPELEAVLSRRIPFASLPEVLRDFFLRQRHRVVVTGTHGKTTTTAMIAHLLAAAGRNPSFLIAGMPGNFPRPYRLGQGEHFVVEGDEYDSAFFAKFPKFLFYLPDLLLINNIEFDHADIYRDLADIERVFAQVINTVPADGLILANGDDPVVARLLPRSPAQVQTYGTEPHNHWRAVGIEAAGLCQTFSVLEAGTERLSLRLPLSGSYNVCNALGAVGAGLRAGLTETEVTEGLESFRGVRRRQEILGRVGGITVIDDFAHHPTAVARTLEGLTLSFPGIRLWAVFEPASATNARDVFEERYLEAFAAAHQVVLTAVPRPDRCGDDPPFSPERLACALVDSGLPACFTPQPEDVVSRLTDSLEAGDAVVFMSNSGFGGIQKLLLSALQEKHGPPPR